MKRIAMALAMALVLSGCVSAEVRERCPNWSMTCGCYCGPGGTWSGIGPPRPKPTDAEIADIVSEKLYPTKIAIVDGRALHPATGKPINCALMAPFEDRLEDFKKPLAGLRYGSWVDDTMFEIRGWKGYAFGVHAGHIRQGVAMSRACRGAETNRNEVTIGMTTEQVTAAWGRPEKINETITADGKTEQWVYGQGQSLHFDNGVLRSIQRSR